jgi:AcrR family transcriptional regulator
MGTSERHFLTRGDWLEAAKRILIAEGVEQVKVQRLAARLKVTRGSFYWHFKSRQELLDALLALWRRSNTEALVAAITRPGQDLEERILALFQLWLDEDLFDHRLDIALRDWGRKKPAVRQAVEEADNQRVAAIALGFREAGFPAPEATTRAAVVYFAQVGFYAHEIRISRAERLRLWPVFYKIYTGRSLSKARLAEIGRR